MVRVAPADVRVLVETDVTDLALEVSVDAAHALVEDLVVPHPDAPGESTLALIERFVAAHFLTAADPQATTIKVGDISLTYEGANITKSGLEETRFGRRALDLDPTNTLRAANKPPAVFETFGHDADDWK